MTYSVEFPDFADMPTDIPAGLVDSSWHNDACPSFTIWQDESDSRLVLWIDHANPSEREVSTAPRFCIALMNDSATVTLAAFDEWPEVKSEVEFLRDNGQDVVKLARYFAALIRAEYTPEELSEVIATNREKPEFESLHDYRDANAYMYGAYCALFFEQPDCGSDHDTALMNHAWNIARQSEYKI